jgi:MFS family permease
LDFLLFFF